MRSPSGHLIWTTEHRHKSWTRGWLIVHDRGRRIAKTTGLTRDAPDFFPTDAHALIYVMAQAAQGDKLCKYALQYIAEGPLPER